MQELRPHLAPLAAALGALVGAGVFFGLAFDPFWGWGLLPVGLGLVVWGLAHRRSLIALALALIMAGTVFGLAAWQVARVEQVDFQAAGKVHWLVGRIVEMDSKEEKPNRVTLRLDNVELFGLGEGAVTGASIGVYKSQVADVKAGDNVALPVILMAPEVPKFKGQRDGRLWRYFNDGRVAGYVLGTVEPTWRGEPVVGKLARVKLWIEAVRTRVYEESSSFAEGAVAALLVGNEKSVTPQLREAYRATGLSHLLAISGMQLTIVALGVFWLMRWMGALIPWVALRVDIRFYAAVTALFATLFYTMLAGASVSLVRASIMASIVMLAVITGRLKSALRGWCAAVVLVLLVSPVMVTRAGFLLSIAAVLGLILLAMAEQGRWQEGKFSNWIRGLVLATVVAGCATAPVLVAIFGQFSVIGMVANLVAVPIMALATYMGMAALVLWPMGLEKPMLEGMAVVVGWVNDIAYLMGSLEYANVTVDRGLWWVVAIFAVVVIVSVLIRRWVEATVALASLTVIMLVAAVTMPKPELMVWDDGGIGLVKEGDAYRLLWAEKPDEALRLAKMARVKLVEGGEVGKTVDEQFMPVTTYEHFAWAERYRGVWRVEPITCGRVWQKAAEGCWVNE